jgi:hypothetical protein
LSEAYELSRQIFEDNASETGDNVTLRRENFHPGCARLMSGYTIEGITNVVAMQNALARWQVRNFGVSSDERMALGLYGELDELNEAESYELALDAWADAAIYAGQLLMNNRLSIAPIIMGSRSWLGESLGHVVLKCAQGIRGIAGDDYRRRLYASVHVALCEAWHAVGSVGDQKSTMAQAYLTVGAEVLKRDWRKFPLNGRDQ